MTCGWYCDTIALFCENILNINEMGDMLQCDNRSRFSFSKIYDGLT